MTPGVRRKDSILSVRLNAEERARVVQAAERHQMGLSEYARSLLLRHVDEPYVQPAQTITVHLTRPDPVIVDREAFRQFMVALGVFQEATP